MISLPNIFKNFLHPPITSYIFPEADKLEIESDEPKAEEEELLEDALTQGTEANELEPEREEEELDEAISSQLKEAKEKLSFAEIQAEKILEDARQQAEELLEEARVKAQEDAQQVSEQAYEDGYRLGYMDGMKKAEIEGQTKLQEQLEQQSEQVRSFLEKASMAKEEMLEQTKNEMCDLSIAVAEKIIHVSLKSSQEVIARMIQMATEKLKRREWVHIYVGGCDAKQLAQITPELNSALAGLSDHVKIIPMANDETGTCIIEMPDAIIDASVSTQVNNIRELLSNS